MQASRMLSLLAMAAIAGCGGSGDATAAAEFPAEAIQATDSQIDALLADGLAPGAIVMVTSPQGSYTKAYGVSDSATKAPMDASMHFRIGSNTKVFTGTLILQLAREGKLDLDDLLSKYIPDVPSSDGVTLRMLGDMTSGLRSYSDNEDFIQKAFADWSQTWTPDELLPYGYALDRKFQPGENFNYSNSNTVLLGLIVEKIEKKPIDQVLQERIFGPVGLSDTVWPKDGELPAPYTHGYSVQNPAEKVEDATHYNPSWGFTAGQLVSNASDLTKWIRQVGQGTLVGSEMQAERLKWKPVGPNNALRHYAFALGEISGWLGHTGELPGYNSTVYYNPTLDATVVILANSDIDHKGRPPAVKLLETVTANLFPKNRIDYQNPIPPDLE